MQVVVNEFGTFVGKKDALFQLRKPNEEDVELAAEEVSQIIISSPAAVSYDAVKLAVEKDVDIVYLDWRGMPIARVFPCRLGGTTLTRRKQLEAYNSEKGALLAKALVDAKILNQAFFLKSLGKTRDDKVFYDNAEALLKHRQKIGSLNGGIDSFRQELLGIEGNCASIYFEALARVLPFEKRDHQGADAVNVFLNYGYGILYSEVEKACILAGLDPYLGFFHTDRYGKPSMALDLVEGFRPIVVDRAVVTLFVQKQFNEDCFEQGGEKGKRLSKTGREKIVSQVMARLHSKITFEGKKTSVQGVILRQARNVARMLLENDFEFKPFVYKW